MLTPDGSCNAFSHSRTLEPLGAGARDEDVRLVDVRDVLQDALRRGLEPLVGLVAEDARAEALRAGEEVPQLLSAPGKDASKTQQEVATQDRACRAPLACLTECNNLWRIGSL